MPFEIVPTTNIAPHVLTADKHSKELYDFLEKNAFVPKYRNQVAVVSAPPIPFHRLTDTIYTHRIINWPEQLKMWTRTGNTHAISTFLDDGKIRCKYDDDALPPFCLEKTDDHPFGNRFYFPYFATACIHGHLSTAQWWYQKMFNKCHSAVYSGNGNAPVIEFCDRVMAVLMRIVVAPPRETHLETVQWLVTRVLSGLSSGNHYMQSVMYDLLRTSKPIVDILFAEACRHGRNDIAMFAHKHLSDNMTELAKDIQRNNQKPDMKWYSDQLQVVMDRWVDWRAQSAVMGYIHSFMACEMYPNFSEDSQMVQWWTTGAGQCLLGSLTLPKLVSIMNDIQCVTRMSEYTGTCMNNLLTDFGTMLRDMQSSLPRSQKKSAQTPALAQDHLNYIAFHICAHTGRHIDTMQIVFDRLPVAFRQKWFADTAVSSCVKTIAYTGSATALTTFERMWKETAPEDYATNIKLSVVNVVREYYGYNGDYFATPEVGNWIFTKLTMDEVTALLQPEHERMQMFEQIPIISCTWNHIKQGNLEMVKWLHATYPMQQFVVNHEEDTDMYDYHLLSSLHEIVMNQFEIACSGGHLEIAQWLLSTAGLNATEDVLRPVFRDAVLCGHLHIAKWLCSLYDFFHLEDTHESTVTAEQRELGVELYRELLQQVCCNGIGNDRLQEEFALMPHNGIIPHGNDPTLYQTDYNELHTEYTALRWMDDIAMACKKSLMMTRAHSHSHSRTWEQIALYSSFEWQQSFIQIASCGNLDALKWLVDVFKREFEQADLSQPTLYTMLNVACGNGHLDVAQWICHYIHVRERGNVSSTPPCGNYILNAMNSGALTRLEEVRCRRWDFHIARDWPDVLSTVVALSRQNNEFPFHLQDETEYVHSLANACLYGYIDMVRWMLAEIRACNCIADRQLHTDLEHALCRDLVPVVVYLSQTDNLDMIRVIHSAIPWFVFGTDNNYCVSDMMFEATCMPAPRHISVNVMNWMYKTCFRRYDILYEEVSPTEATSMVMSPNALRRYESSNGKVYNITSAWVCARFASYLTEYHVVLNRRIVPTAYIRMYNSPRQYAEPPPVVFCNELQIDNTMAPLCLDTVPEEDRVCSVCSAGTIQLQTECKHSFCESCLKSWMVEHQKSTCPICRSVVKLLVPFQSDANRSTTVEAEATEWEEAERRWMQLEAEEEETR